VCAGVGAGLHKMCRLQIRIRQERERTCTEKYLELFDSQS
jgi:hypothetical protein